VNLITLFTEYTIINSIKAGDKLPGFSATLSADM